MIYDYQEKKGYVSLWIGKCKNYNIVDDYLSTIYLDENDSDIWKDLYIPANKNRDCEEELKEYFNYEYFNQFEYDFGLSFDEDFREAEVLDYDTKNIRELFDGFSYYDLFRDKLIEVNDKYYLEFNTAIALYDFKYEGNIVEAEHENIHLYFLGYFEYSSGEEY